MIQGNYTLLDYFHNLIINQNHRNIKKIIINLVGK